MNHSLWLAALVMGWAGSPHCLAMCGPLCATQSTASSQVAFQCGRLSGYALAGALAGASMQLVGQWSVQVQSLRSLWSFIHALFLVMGVWMLVRGDQPSWLIQSAAQTWRWMQKRVGVSEARLPTSQRRSIWRSYALGGVWVFWPCGLLYSALTLAALSGTVWQGAWVMTLFALGSGVVLSLVPWLWQRIQVGQRGAWAHSLRQGGIRLAGLVLAVMSAWALWTGLVMNQAPWCVSPQ